MSNKMISDKFDILAEKIFFVIFFLWFSLEYLYSLDISNYSWGTNSYYLHLLSPLKYSIILYIILFRKYSLRDWILISFTAILLFYSAKKSTFYDIFYAFLFVVASKEEYKQKMIRMTVHLLAIYLLLTIVAALTGLVNNTQYYRNDGLVRYSLGFPHPNQVGFRFFILISGLLWLRNGIIKPFDYVAVILSILFTWFVINSRTSCICIILIAIGSLFYNSFHKLSDAYQRKILYLLCAVALLTNITLLLLAVFYTGEGIPVFINKVLSQRLAFGHEAFKEFGTNLLGQQIFVTATERKLAGLGEEIIIDSAYINILMRSGIIVFLVFVAGYELAIIRLSSKRSYMSFIILFILSIYGSIELMIYLPMWNVFLIFLTEIFKRRENERTLAGHFLYLIHSHQ